MSDKTKTCPQCGETLTEEISGGLCPRCVMEMNLSPDTAETLSGEVPTVDELAPHFPQLEILGCLGRGGMGIVYKARQPQLDRFVALKILAPERVDDVRFAERFRREGMSLAKLDHPNIVTVYDTGESGGYYYLLMEYVDGLNLREAIAGEKMAAQEALAIVPLICAGLQYAHECGVVHRDIKPENILLDKKGRVKIADFGVAKLVYGPEETEETSSVIDGGAGLTLEGKLGTPQYMAPEQEEKSAAADHRADIYALGVVFYEMLTGERPKEDFVVPSKKVEVDVRIDEIVLRALEKEPKKRYQSAEEFRSVVETVAGSAVDYLSRKNAPRLIVSRDSGCADLLRGYQLLLDGERLGMIYPGEVQSYDVSPGEHTLQAKIDWFTTDFVTFTAGERICFYESYSKLRGWNLLKTPFTLLRKGAWIGLREGVASQQLMNLEVIDERNKEARRSLRRSRIMFGALGCLFFLLVIPVVVVLGLWVSYAALQSDQPPSELVTAEEMKGVEEVMVVNSWEGSFKGAFDGRRVEWDIIEFARAYHWLESSETSYRLRKEGSILVAEKGNFLYYFKPMSESSNLVFERWSKESGRKTAEMELERVGEGIEVILKRQDGAGLIRWVDHVMKPFLERERRSPERNVVEAKVMRAMVGQLDELKELVEKNDWESIRKMTKKKQKKQTGSGDKFEVIDASNQSPVDTFISEKFETEKDAIKGVAQKFMKAVSALDPDAANELMFLKKELGDKEHAQRLRDFTEMKQAYEKEPSLQTTFSEWFRVGGYVVTRVTPPKGGTGRSLYLILGLKEGKEWKVLDVSDVGQGETLKEVYESYSNKIKKH